jgi:hypothetical protein
VVIHLIPRLHDLSQQDKEILMRISNAEYLQFENELLQLELKEVAFEQFKQAKRHVSNLFTILWWILRDAFVIILE